MPFNKLSFARSLYIAISTSNFSMSDSTQKLVNNSVFRADYADKINIFRNNKYIGADKVNRERACQNARPF